MRRKNTVVHPSNHNQAVRYAVAMALASSQAAMAAGPPALPVPCFAGSCAPNKTQGFSYQSAGGATVGPAGFLTSGAATATQAGNTLTVTQTSSQAILNWQSFNIGAGGVVQFTQPSSTAVALNKIYQASPSSIFGALTANGQIYLINPNGFVFGNGAVVNVGGLVASSLGFYGGDATFTAGLTSNSGSTTSTPRPALTSDGRVYVTDANGNLVLDSNGNSQQVQVQVQSGASLTAADGGRIMLVGQVVSNAGELSAPDGQVVLAAGQTVYLQSSSDPSVRGLVVAVNMVAQDSSGNAITGPAPPASMPEPALAVGTVANSGTGANGISAPRGNVSLLGLAVNQNGRISASTSVSANGSVILEAGQGNPVNSAQGYTLDDTVGGMVTIGPGSDIEIPLDSSTATAAVAQAQTPSSVTITGQQVYMDGGAIDAPGGQLAVLAASNPSQGLRTEGNSDAQIRVAAGTSIDLAGSDAVVPMSSNLVSIQLLSNELEDDPDQRTGALHGQTVIADVRDGRPAIISDASWQSVLQGIQENVAQRTSAGGSASFQSEGDVVVNSGATINVSGGKWTYTPGVIQTSELIGANGQTDNIETANPELTYTGVLNPTYTQAYQGFGIQETGTTPGLSQTESGYMQGFSAGTVTLVAPAMVMQGTLVGTAVNGAYQRSASSIPAESLAAVVANGGVVPASGAVAMALGGTLRIGDPNAPGAPGPAGETEANFFAPAVDFVNIAAPVVIADGTPLPAQPLQLPVNYITSGGFSQTQIFSDSTVTLPPGLPLNLGSGGSLLVLAPRINIDSSIQALGGSINLESVQTADSLSSSTRLGIDVADAVTLNVSGQWTNDSILAPASPQTALYQDGGSIILSLQPNSNLLPSGIFSIVASSGTTNVSQYQFDTSGGELTLGNNVSLLANGGAWLQANKTLTGGTGGAITLAASADQAALQVGSNVELAAFGVQGAAGGSFTLEAPRLLVQNGSSWTGAQSIDDLQSPGSVFDVGSALYSQDGFSAVNLLATAAVPLDDFNKDILTVAAGTQLDATAQSLQLSGSYVTRGTGGTVQGFSQSQLLNVAYQTPSSLSFTGSRSLSANSTNEQSGDIDIQAGATITVGPGVAGAIDLTGQGSILIDGVLQAHGGSISAQIEAPANSGAQILDPGYVAGQRIELGSQSVLDVSGVAVLTPNAHNLPIGTVLPGGSVSLGMAAGRGEVVADSGSYINISGGSSTLAQQDLGPSGGYTTTTVGSAGGSLAVNSGEAISLLGTLAAAGGIGASAEGAIEGGSLSVSLQAVFATPVTTPLFAGPFTIDLMPSLSAGAAAETDESGTALLSIAGLESSGIGSLTLTAGGSIAAPTGGTIDINPGSSSGTASGSPVVLSFNQQVTLDAATIAVSAGTQATITAPLVSFTDSYPVTAAQAAQTTTTGGTGSLTVNAQEIALSGYSWVKGTQTVALNSANDVQLDPIGALQYAGAFTAPINLDITANRIFPATLASYTLSAGDNLNVAMPAGSDGSAPAVPLSVGGTVILSATNVTDNGAILAPFGNVTLSATNQLTLGAGSYTSVSAPNGTVLPFGTTTYGQQEWLYTANNATTASTSYGVSGISELNSLLPGTAQSTGSRTIVLSGSTVQLQDGSTVNVSGGGDLSAYEWVPGLGGSIDALSQASAKANNLYAIIPGSSPYAAYDMQEFPGSNTAVGQSVYLSGVAGLPAGFYALLPARYALLPGAFLIQEEPSYHSLTPGTLGVLANGAPVITGYLTYGNGSTGLTASAAASGVRASSGYAGFAVWPGSYAEQLADYDVTTASSFFPTFAATSGQTAAAVVPADAGTLAVAVNGALELGQHSIVNTAAGSSGGSVGTVDLYTTGGSGIFVGTGQGPTGTVTVDPVALENWGAGDLIIGGSLQANGNIAVSANTVEFGADASLSAQQIVAVANTSILIDAGATLASTSGSNGNIAAPTVQQDPLWLTTPAGTLNENAALLAVSDVNLPIVLRTAAGTGPASIGIVAGATLSTRGAVTLDAPGGVAIADGATINASGASWSLASDSIGFVAAGAVTAVASGGDTLQIDPSLLAQMNTAASLRLASAGAVDILTSLSLGAPSLTQLTLDAATVNDQAASASFTAQTISLQGAGPVQAPTQAVTPLAALPTQSLTFSGGEIDFGGAGNPVLSGTGSLAINDYGQSATTSFVASGSIVGQGQTQLAVNGGNVILQAAQVTAEPLPAGPLTTAVVAAEPGSTAQTALTAVQTAATVESQSGITASSGSLQILPNGAAASTVALSSSLGGGLSLTADAITDSGTIIVPGGRIALSTTSGDLTLDSGADLDVSGISVTVANQTRAAAGGIVDLTAAGNLLLSPGSAIDVAGAAGSADGFLNLVAVRGNATVGASLNGGSPTDDAGGSFSLYAGQQLTGGLPALLGSLGGFTSAISVEIGSGNLDLAAGGTLTANQVMLSADSGAIDIAGTINAPSAGLRGSIGLFAQGNVTLESTATLSANASTTNDDSSGRGGDIELSTVAGTIDLPASATAANGIFSIGAAGDGSLLLRAPTVGGDDVSINPIAANLNGVGQLTVEPVLQTADYVAAGSVVPTGDFTVDDSGIAAAVQTYYGTAANVIPARLLTGAAADIPLVVEPGVVVNETATTTTLSTAIDLYDDVGAGSGNGVGIPIDLTVRAVGSLTIKGGISDGTDDDGNLLDGASSSLRFVAGANLASANPLGVVPGLTSATLTLGSATARAGQGTILETGTGDIDLISSGQIVINPFSGAVTTGMLPVTTAGVATRTLNSIGTLSYMDGGGNISVDAGTNIVATNVQENISAWLSYTTTDLANGTEVGLWGANLSAFAADPWSVATLGGGDVQVTAGGNITKMSVAASGGMDAGLDAQIPYASGGLSVDAGGNIAVGQFFLADGSGSINAGGAFTTTAVTASTGGAPINVGSLLALQNSQLSLWAEDGIAISAIVNPTMLPQPKANGATVGTVFASYGPESAINAQTSSGTLALNALDNTYQAFTGLQTGSQSTESTLAYAIFPTTLDLASLSQDISLGTASTGITTGTLYPSATGQYQLFAARDIIGGRIYMSDAAAGTVSTAADVIAGVGGLSALSQVGAGTTSYGSAANFSGDLHAGDTTEASIAAGRDISFMALSLPEPAQIIAGRDIVDLAYQGQNLSASDTTLISAGRNFTYPLTFLSTGQANSVSFLDDLSGPGSLDILAGGTINLGFSLGVTTSGNFRNANLPAGGATITMAAGLGRQPDDAAFLTNIIEPSASYQSQLVSYVESLTSQAGLTGAQADAELSGTGPDPTFNLTNSQEQAFIDTVFFNELNLSGIEETTVAGAGYARGYTAIDTLFPGTPTTLGTTANNAFSGDLDLIYSQINTQSGGSINLLVPGGAINVGVATAPAAEGPKPASELGIVASNTGNVDIYSLDDVNVNSSRIFALGGGNILIWSQLGSIDAGNGAKSSLSIPPPVISYDSQGNPYVNFGAAVSGSGIRTIQTGLGEVAGNVNLIAPVGTVNAGDAGIGAAGNINIAAAAVVGAANINFGGTATGVPATVSGITAAVSAAAGTAAGATSSATSSETNSSAAQSQAPAAAAALSWLDVFVSGLGMDNCKPEDVDCLKRQQHTN